MKISILGYMGSGKSTIGRQLANQIGLDFVDLDQKIEKDQNKSISELFSTQGHIKFRKIEKHTLDKILIENENFVLALGGGTPAYYDNIDVINQHSISIYLRVQLPTLIERLNLQKENRPMISHLDPDDMPEFVAKHFFERKVFYENAQLIIDVRQKTENEIVEEIIQHLQLK